MILSAFQRWALYLFFFSIAFEVLVPFSSGYALGRITGLIYLLFLLPDIKYFLSVQKIKQFLYPILIFFLILTFVNIINGGNSIFPVFDMTLFQNIFLLWFLINHEKKEPGVLDKGMLSFALGSVFLAHLYLLGIGVEYKLGRVTIFGDNANATGLKMSISIIIFILFLVQNNINIGRWRFIFILLIPGMFLLLLDSGSRLAFFSFTLSFLAMIFLLKTKSFIQKLIYLSFASLLAYFIYKYFFIKSEVLLARIMLSIHEGDLSGRDVIWKTIIPLIKENLLFGVGSTGYNKFAFIFFGDDLSPHNVILEILAFTGITGLLVYLIFLIRVIKNSLKYYFETGYLLQLLLLIPIAGAIVSSHLLSVKIGWIIYAYICSKVFFLNSSKDSVT